jgi:hypothetical protein
MQAITTKHLSNSGRIKAFCESGNIIINKDYSLDTEKAHKKAAIALLEKLGWENKGLISGSTEYGYVFDLLNNNNF